MNLCHEVVSFDSGHNMDVESNLDLPLTSSPITDKLFKPLASVYIPIK